MEEIDLAYRDALNGMPSRRPLIEMTIPSVLDKTISPPGKTYLQRLEFLNCQICCAANVDLTLVTMI